MPKIRHAILNYNLKDELPLSYGRKLRGFFANNFEHILFHHHKHDGNYRYAYPLIQYKIIAGQPLVIGLNRGAELLVENFLDIDHLRLGNDEYCEPDSRLEVTKKQVKTTDTMNYKYQFLTPWLGLNQKNYRRYVSQIQNKGYDERQKFLQQILIGNILAFAKGIDWWVEREIKVKCSLEEERVKFKDQSMIGFRGELATNIWLPNYIGLGKSTARGFGALKRTSLN